MAMEDPGVFKREKKEVEDSCIERLVDRLENFEKEGWSASDGDRVRRMIYAGIRARLKGMREAIDECKKDLTEVAEEDW